MAEAILYGVAQKMIENLGSQIFQEIGSLWGVQDELDNIKSIVSRIQAVLQDAAEQQSQNHPVRDWLEKLKDAVYEADDLLSEFSAEASRQRAMSGNKITKEVRTFFSKSNQLAFRHEMSRKIKAMRKKLDAIAKENRDFNLKVHLPEKYSVSIERETHSFVPNEVIGREDDKEAIINLLLDPNVEVNVSVLSIVGIGGLGKTTLAQYVYNDETVNTHFDLKMWVCVSNDFEVKLISEKIIAAATKNEPKDLHMDELQKQLHQTIDGKKYLLVLDDVWNESYKKWDSLKSLLMGGAKGSKILITTRAKLVAEITESVSIHTLTGLSEDQSWSLFKQIVFRKGQETNNPKLVEIGREILGKCQGVPLAIKSVGSVLCLDKTEAKWSYVKDNILVNVLQFGEDILPILKLSYDHLPSHLKTCFAYCSLFPKDYVIDKETMIQLWIAQGFIQSSNKNEQLEDVGDEYFKDLLSRSFFEEVITESFGKPRYKMHALIHDLAQYLAGKDCKLVDFDCKNINVNIRHVSCPFSIDSSFIEALSSLVKVDKIRTFLLTIGESRSTALKGSMLNTFILNFRSLRALDLHGLWITRVPNSLGKLIHLKYLDLSFNDEIITLPDSITTLQNLQTLKLSFCGNLKELPRDIRELVNLRHLDNSDCDALSHMPRGLGQMTCLQTLPLFVVSKEPPSISKHVGGLSELKRLNNLRGTLEIRHLELLEDANAEFEAANLSKKQHLENLILRWYPQDQVHNADYEQSLEGLQPHQNLKYLKFELYGRLRFPTWLSSLTNLVKFALFGCKKLQHLPPLDQFPSLKVLELDSLSAVKYISNSEEFSNSSFPPSLEELKLMHCPHLKGWWRRSDSMGEVNDDTDNYVEITTATTSTVENHLPPSFHSLSKLCIWSCPQLISMPLFPFLEKLELYYCNFKPLEQTTRIAAAVVASTSPFSSTLATSSFAPLSKLKSLEIGGMEEPLPEECMQNLISLERLWIYECRGPLPQGMCHLTALKQLDICSSEVLDLSNDENGMEFQSLRNLSSLWLFNLPKLKSLPVGLKHITSLRKLTIDYCPCLTEMPEWICSVTSLKILEIVQCPKLMSLPEDFHLLNSLHTLKIFHCPTLLERCKKERGKDWRKIAHIPNLYLEEGNTDGEGTLSVSIDGLKEIYGLNALSGMLEIGELRHGKGAALKSKDANLKETRHLQGLKLKWIEEDLDESKVGYDEKSLEALQPHPNLQQLDLSNYGGVRFPSGISSLRNLVRFSLINCNKCQHLPPLDQFHSLKLLYLNKLDSLEYISERDKRGVFSDFSLFPSLKELTLSHCPNLKGWWPQGRYSIEESPAIEFMVENHLWPSFPRLSKVCILGCPKLTSMPLFQTLEKLEQFYRSIKPEERTTRIAKVAASLYQFPSLMVLELNSLPALEYISNSEEFFNSSLFPSLEELKLECCPNLKGWWQRRRDSMEEINDDIDNYVGITTATTSMAQNHLPPSFPRLSKLCIRKCPQLASMPLFPFLENLELYKCSFKPLEQTRIAAAVVASTSSFSSTLATSSFAPLSKLKSLEIELMEEPLPEECMQNLISLKHLWIYEFRGPLPQGMRHLTALEQLDICSSEVLDLSNDENGMEWQSLRNLSSLWLFQLPKLKSLPVGLKHVTSLQKLTIDYCPCLTELPEWICSLTSLEILEIVQCPKLMSLPEDFRLLSSLQMLKIHHCPILFERCKREIGSDWGKVAHIPKLYLEERNSDGGPREKQKKLDLLRRA